MPALTFDPEREDSNSKMEPSELLSKTLPKICHTQTVMHSQASSHVGKQNYGTKSVHNSIQKLNKELLWIKKEKLEVKCVFRPFFNCIKAMGFE